MQKPIAKNAMPVRIQRKRTKGWKMPENTVCVDRTSRWGNPFKVGIDGDAKECVRKYAESLTPYRHYGQNSSMDKLCLSLANIEWIEGLRGKNLACWCPLNQPCHADILLEIANGQ